MRYLLLTALLAQALPGCKFLVDDGQSSALFIIGNKTLSSDCTVEPNESGPYFTRGTLDLVLATGYRFSALVKNQMPRTTETQVRTLTDQRIDVATVKLTSATVGFSFPEAPFDALTFDPVTVRVAGTVFPNDGVSAVGVPVIPPEVMQGLLDTLPPRSPENSFPGAEILVDIQMFGNTLDGGPVRTDQFRYPILVCRGCLLLFPATAAQPGNPNCRSTEQSTDLEAPCLPGQDDAVDCRICRQLKRIAERNDCEPL